ncbi:MAG: site-2 protease family protein [Actinomycetota bacterium]|nr:site-2 protease family protein [Actinomycetota bacterium]
MRDTVRLGRLGGVPVGLNWSLVVVAGLLAYVLAENRLPNDAPGYATVGYATTGVLTAVGLLATVLAHELGHAVVARKVDLRVDGITLSWIGGITRIEGEASSPLIEAGIAGIGPLVSLVIGGGLWALRIGLSAAGVGRLAVAAIGWLAVINVVLGVFNLLPAAPLDGGRLLHAAAWRITGDRWRAGHLASSAGVVLGVLVLLAGAWEASRGRTASDTFNALVTGLLGWWLISVARSERHVADVHRVLDGCRCADVMRPVAEGPGWVTIDTFLAGCPADQHNPGLVWLLEGWGADGYVGVVTAEALISVSAAQRHVLRPIDVAIPVTEAAGAGPSDDVLETLASGTGARVILVIDGRRTVGAIVPADIDSLVHLGRRAIPVMAAPSGAGAPS